MREREDGSPQALDLACRSYKIHLCSIEIQQGQSHLLAGMQLLSTTGTGDELTWDER